MLRTGLSRRGLAGLAASLIATATLGTGCLDRRRAEAGAPRTSELAIGYADPRPRASRERGIATIITNLTSERLVSLRRDARPEPALAERWDESPDGLTWRFTLRPGLTLHDGSPLDAATVRASIEREIASAATPGSLLPGLRSVVRIEAEGDRVVVFHLSRPNAFLLESLYFVPPRGGKNATESAGPFRLISRDQEGVVFSAFPQYYRGRPQLERIHIREYPSPRNAWGAMMRGEIDALYDVPLEALDFIEQSSTTYVATFLRPFVMTLVLNHAHPVLGKRDVRVALNRAIDRSGIIDAVLRGRGLPATDHVWPKHWAYDTSQARFEFDPAAAATLLDGAGLRPTAGPAGRRARFSFNCLVPSDDPRWERVALLVQRQLVEIGVDMRLEGVTVPVLQQRIKAGDYDAFIQELMSSYGFPWIDWFWHSTPPSPFMTTGYHGADAVLDRLRGNRNDEELRTGMRALRDVMHRDPPAVFLFWNETARAVSRRFDVPRVPDRDILNTVAQWRLATPPTE